MTQVFSELLEMSNESAIHIKNIKVLMTEINKFLNDLSPPIMTDIFQKQENYYIDVKEWEINK